MKKILLPAVWLISIAAFSQENKFVSLAVFTTQNDLPFGKFTGLFREIFHPGIEAGYGKIIASQKKHDWTAELKLGYFYHRFVQHGIPLYASMGYHYKINKRLTANTSLGAGYMHSIPATAKLKLNGEGEYVNNKGLGRMQAIITCAAGMGYTLNPGTKRPLKIFASYQQKIQLPFVKSYVPLLPYNSFMIGCSRSLHKKSTK